MVDTAAAGTDMQSWGTLRVMKNDKNLLATPDSLFGIQSNNEDE